MLVRQTLIPKGVFIFHVFRYSILASNPCAANEGRGPCSHMCLINHNRSAACACPHLMKLSLDKKTCYGKFGSQSLTIVLILGFWTVWIKIHNLTNNLYSAFYWCILLIHFKGTSTFWEQITYSNIWGVWGFHIYYHSHFFCCLCVWHVSQTYLCKTEGFIL